MGNGCDYSINSKHACKTCFLICKLNFVNIYLDFRNQLQMLTDSLLILPKRFTVYFSYNTCETIELITYNHIAIIIETDLNYKYDVVIEISVDI